MLPSGHLARLVVFTCCLAFLLPQSQALVTWGRLVPWQTAWQPPVTNWLLSTDRTIIPPSQQLAWRKIGSKIWTFMDNLDHDFVDATGKTTPPALATQRIFGPAVTCGRFARIFLRMAFHDCGTFDVGDTNSFQSTKQPRFGCNGSLRWELATCEDPAPQCVNGLEAAFDLATGALLPENPFTSLEAKYGAANVQWGQDKVDNRRENSGMANALSVLYQIKLETEFDEPPATRAQVSLADIISYAGFLAVAKCGGPHVEFQPGRTDSTGFDANARLPAPTEPLFHTQSYFWTNGLTNFDMVNLLTAHSTACFGVGCLDNTPSRFDPDWVRQIMSVTTATDPRICKFAVVDPPEPPQPELPEPPIDLPQPGPAPVPMCFLPADVEFNARADTRNYLMALNGQMAISAAAAAGASPCFYQPGVPEIHGSCDVGVGVGYDFNPFKIVRLPNGENVNLCSRATIPLENKSHCPRGPGALPSFQNAVASSLFKMSKMYATATGAVAGAPFGVQRQPCQPGLILIGRGFGVAQPNPGCLCCPTPPPQDFNLNLEPGPLQPGQPVPPVQPVPAVQPTTPPVQG